MGPKEWSITPITQTHTECRDPNDATSLGWRWPMAICKADVTKHVAMEAAQAKPTTLRENRSTTMAIDSHPSWVKRALISLPHTRLGAATVNCRLSRFVQEAWHGDSPSSADTATCVAASGSPGASGFRSLDTPDVS